MAETADRTILRRMTEAAGTGTDPALRVLGTSLARAAEAVLGLPLRLTGVGSAPVSLADLPDRVEERALFALIEAPGERLGLAVMSAGLVGAVIEMLTTGRLSPAGPHPRRPTRTDAALSAGLIDRILSETDAAAAEGETPWPEWDGPFRYASSVEDARLLPLLLDDLRYRLVHCTLALGHGGERTATLAIVLPERQRTGGRAAADDGAAWQARLAESVLEAEAGITAVLARISRPLAEVAALAPGAVLRLPDDALDGLRLEGAGRRFLAQARLGQYRGYLAVRLSGTPAADAGGSEFIPAKAGQTERGAVPAMKASGG